VAIVADYPGSFPSPAVNKKKKKKTSHKRQVSTSDPDIPVPIVKRRRSARLTPAAATVAESGSNKDPADRPVTGASAPASSSQRYFA
jgi:hypothetical protein